MKMIQVLNVSGTHYEVGHEIGRTFKDNIVEASEIWEQCRDNVKFIEGLGKEVLEGYKAVAEKSYPQYVEEINGMVDGAGIQEEKIWAMNLWVELYRNPKHNPQFASSGEHCSDIIVNNKDTMVNAHNEDAMEGFEGLGYIVTAHITDARERGKFWVPEERFTAYCWPGMLPGYCFGFNSHGITHSINTMYPDLLMENKTAVAFLVRAALNARSFDDIERIFCDDGQGISCGISLNAGCSQQDCPTKFCNFEVVATSADHSLVKKTTIGVGCDVNGPYYHANAYIHLPIKTGQSKFGETSIKRTEYYNSFPPPTSLKDVIEIIGDQGPTGDKQEDTLYNLYTVATGIFDLKANTLAVYSDNPKTTECPEHTFKLP